MGDAGCEGDGRDRTAVIYLSLGLYARHVENDRVVFVAALGCARRGVVGTHLEVACVAIVVLLPGSSCVGPGVKCPDLGAGIDGLRVVNIVDPSLDRQTGTENSPVCGPGLAEQHVWLHWCCADGGNAALGPQGDQQCQYG